MRARIRKSIIYGIRLFTAAMMGIHPTTGFALEVELKRGINLRSYDGTQMSVVGYLKKGTVVEVPDEYAIKRNGKVNFELTLNNWLRKAGKLTKGTDAGLYKFNDKKHDYFFPIKIKKKAHGSQVNESKDQKLFIALKHMARKKRAMIVQGTAPVYAAKEAARQPDQEKAAEQTEAAHAGYCEECVKDPVDNLLSDLPLSLKRVGEATRRNKKRSKTELRNTPRSFHKNCGIRWNEFTEVISSEVNGNRDQISMLQKLMLQESSGNCTLVSAEHNGTASVGLFQINTNSSTYDFCSKEELSAIKSASADDLRTKYQCLQNPIVSLKEGIRLLKVKRRALKYYGFDFNKMTSKDRLRYTLSAYNGGEKWVQKAKEDLEEFNTKQGTDLNSHSWEDIRLFYLRRALTKNEQRDHFGSYKIRRLLEHGVTNLAYAEAMVPRGSGQL